MDARLNDAIDRNANNSEAATFGLPDSEPIGGAPDHQGGNDGNDVQPPSREVPT